MDTVMIIPRAMTVKSKKRKMWQAKTRANACDNI